MSHRELWRMHLDMSKLTLGFGIVVVSANRKLRLYVVYPDERTIECKSSPLTITEIPVTTEILEMPAPRSPHCHHTPVRLAIM